MRSNPSTSEEFDYEEVTSEESYDFEDPTSEVSSEVSSDTPVIYQSTVDLSTVEGKLEEIRVGVGFVHYLTQCYFSYLQYT